MLSVLFLFLILFSLALLIIVPDRFQARREIARRQAEARRESRKARSRAQSK